MNPTTIHRAPGRADAATNPRTIKLIAIHCTASNPETTTVEGILNYWREVRGWQRPGYHYLIFPDGTLYNLCSEAEQSNGIRYHNHEAIHVSYVGGINSVGAPEDTRTLEQRLVLKELVLDLLYRYPDAQVVGHYALTRPQRAKACPSFDVPCWAKAVGIPAAKVYHHPKALVRSC